MEDGHGTLRDKIRVAATDAVGRLGEQMKSRDEAWSTKNFTHPLPEGLVAEIEVKVRVSRPDSTS